MKAFTSRLKALSDSMSDLMTAEKEDSQVAASRNLSVFGPEDQALIKAWGVTVAQENKLVAQFRSELEQATKLPPSVDDYCLRRFLRARKHAVPKAKEMFLDQLEWRKANDVDSVLTGFVFEERRRFFDYYPEGFYCTDRAGRPVYIQQPGKVNTEELWKFTTLERCVRYHIKQQERYLNEIIPCAALASGHRQEQSIVLIDMDGVGVSTLTGEVRKILALVMEIDQNNYPELMYKTLVINAPTTFRMLWAMIRHLLDARTQAKIQVLPADFKEALQQFIAPENLMQQYGGTNTTPLIDEPGPWQDPQIQAKLAALGSDWGKGLRTGYEDGDQGVEPPMEAAASAAAPLELQEPTSQPGSGGQDSGDAAAAAGQQQQEDGGSAGSEVPPADGGPAPAAAAPGGAS